MALRGRVSIVCRDCGEVTHHPLAGLKPDAMVSCAACGLVIDPTPFRGPAVNLGFAARGESPGPQPRRGPGAKVRP